MTILSLRAALPAATAAHDHIDPRFGIQERGKHTFAGRRLTVAGWRALAHRFTVSDFGLDARRRTALVAAMRYFDAALGRPIRVIHVAGWREVEVLGAVSYLANLADRKLAGMFTDRAGVKRPVDAEIALFPALHGSWWIAQTLDALGLDWRDQPGDEPAGEPCSLPTGTVEVRILAALHRMLHADARFRLLRLRVAEQVVGPDVLALAIRARVSRRNACLTLVQAQHVWRCWAHYAEAARHAPKLLPLLALWLRDRARIGEPGDVLHHLKASVLDAGGGSARLGGQAWKYLMRHGARVFAEPLRRVHASDMTIYAVHGVLRALAEAGLPEPPSPALWRVWSAVNAAPARIAPFRSTWCCVPVRVRRLVLEESVRRRHWPDYAQWVACAGDVLWSATEPRLPALRLPAGATWTDLQAACLRRRQETAARMEAAGLRWESAVESCTIDGMRVVPLASGIDLLDESRAMGNCLADRAGEALSGQHRYFSLRAPGGRRIADVQIENRNGWRLAEVARRFNAPATARDAAIGRQIAAHYQAAAQVADNPTEPPQEKAA